MRTSHKGKTTAALTQTEAILESISDGVFTVDLEWRITSFNRAAEEITGIHRHEAIGRRCCDVFRASVILIYQTVLFMITCSRHLAR